MSAIYTVIFRLLALLAIAHERQNVFFVFLRRLKLASERESKYDLCMRNIDDNPERTPRHYDSYARAGGAGCSDWAACTGGVPFSARLLFASSARLMKISLPCCSARAASASASGVNTTSSF